MPQNYLVWNGYYEFNVTGTDRYENTLRLESNYKFYTYRTLPKEPINTDPYQQFLSLTLPTLCITYADMDFSNAIGGMQENYPSSSIYGKKFFGNAKLIFGNDVEKYTWIRGAPCVVIGAKETNIFWNLIDPLVIPRLHIDSKNSVVVRMTSYGIIFRADHPIIIWIKQYADGRQIGGIDVGVCSKMI